MNKPIFWGMFCCTLLLAGDATSVAQTTNPNLPTSRAATTQISDECRTALLKQIDELEELIDLQEDVPGFIELIQWRSALGDMEGVERMYSLLPSDWREEGAWIIGIGCVIGGDIDRGFDALKKYGSAKQRLRNIKSLFVYARAVSLDSFLKYLEAKTDVWDKDVMNLGYEQAVKGLIFNERLQEAEEFYQKISDDKNKAEANRWILAAKICDGQLNAEDELKKAGEQGLPLRNIVELRVEKGDVGKIDSFARFFDSDDVRSLRMKAAEYYAKQKLIPETMQQIELATNGIGNATGDISDLRKISVLSQATLLSLQCGSKEKAAVFLKQLEECVNVFSGSSGDLSSGLLDVFQTRPALVMLMAEVGDIAGMERVAGVGQTKEMSPNMAVALILAYRKCNQNAKAAELEQKFADDPKIKRKLLQTTVSKSFEQLEQDLKDIVVKKGFLQPSSVAEKTNPRRAESQPKAEN